MSTFYIEDLNGFSFKIRRNGGGDTAEELKGVWSSRAQAQKAIDTHLEKVYLRLDNIEKKQAVRNARNRRCERAAAKGK